MDFFDRRNWQASAWITARRNRSSADNSMPRALEPAKDENGSETV